MTKSFQDFLGLILYRESAYRLVRSERMHPHLTPALSPPSEGAEREKICGSAVASPYHGSTSREGVGLFHEFAAGPFDVALHDF